MVTVDTEQSKKFYEIANTLDEDIVKKLQKAQESTYAIAQKTQAGKFITDCENGSDTVTAVVDGAKQLAAVFRDVAKTYEEYEARFSV